LMTLRNSSRAPVKGQTVYSSRGPTYLTPEAAPVVPPRASAHQIQLSSAKGADGVVGGVPGGVSGALIGDTLTTSARVSPSSVAGPFDRKIVRTGTMDLTVTSPGDAAEKIRAFAEAYGGYVESAQVNSNQESPTASITIRVPASRLEDAKTQLRKLAAHVDAERADAQDVTKQYVDLEARIHNLRAEEAQYLVIMKSAAKVQDMLDVSEHVSQVRGEIEAAQAEFQTLSKQIEMVAISISLRVPPPAETFAFTWQPMRRIRMAVRDTLEGLADYGLIMISTILYLPVLLLWVGTILLGTVFAWRVIRYTGRRLFAWPKPAAPSGSIE